MYQPILQNQQNQELIIGAPEIPISIEYMAQQPQCQPLIQLKDRRKFLVLLMLTCFCQTGLELAISLISAYSINIQDLKLSFAIPIHQSKKFCQFFYIQQQLLHLYVFLEQDYFTIQF
ncbi:unnamed protein product [Paramecium primaurelia]|uniref:Transmembrane protein n=1 Tax=Paramecium primaurelia TaxID=5886 RepID=A0A8S1PBY7_PARPR|nr:unnamed protein product [Paramecium primaurelia]CAD8100233.1 unnamed protein product [Paramecium primaurelia]